MRRKGEVIGSFTLEAVFILPCICIGIFFLLYLSLYLHDIVYVQSVLDEAVQNEALLLKRPSDFSSSRIQYNRIFQQGVFDVLNDKHEDTTLECKEFIKSMLDSRLMISHYDDIIVETNQSEILVRVTIRINLSLLILSKYFSNLSDFTISSFSEVHNPSDFSYKVDVIDGVISEIKGLSRLKDIYNSICNNE